MGSSEAFVALSSGRLPEWVQLKDKKSLAPPRSGITAIDRCRHLSQVPFILLTGNPASVGGRNAHHP